MATTGEFGGSIEYLNELLDQDVVVELATRKVTGKLANVFNDSLEIDTNTGSELLFAHAIHSIKRHIRSDLKPAVAGAKLF